MTCRQRKGLLVCDRQAGHDGPHADFYVFLEHPVEFDLEPEDSRTGGDRG